MRKLLLSCMLLLGMGTTVYAETIKVATGLGEEITSLDFITNGGTFVISDGSKVKYFTSGQNSLNGDVADVPYDSYFNCTLEKVDDSSASGDNIYRIRVKNVDNTKDHSGVAGGCYLNTPNSGWSIVFTGVSAIDGNVWGTPRVYGTDAENYGLWYVTYDEENGFSFQNVGKANGADGWPSWMTVADLSGSQTYIKLYKSVEFEDQELEEVVKEDVAANATIFDITKAEGYDAETGVMTNGGWTFDEPISILDWDYIVIVTSNTAADASHEISITDENGKSVSGEGYAGGTAGTGGNMWLDRWNNQNAIRISVDFLRINKGIDVKKIKSLKISGSISLSCVYLTDYNNAKINGGYAGGDVVRAYGESGQFGTICLPYVASCAGAEVYSIEGKNDDGISLKKETGLLEAGKPYIYVGTDVNGQNNDKSVFNVNFFRADLEKFDVTEADANNGLIGTFAAIDSEDNIIIKANQVDLGAVVANGAYIDLENIEGVATEATIPFSEVVKDIATAIKGVNKASLSGVIFNAAGQQMKSLQKGINIVDGAKVYVK